ncbi:MAG TPA: enoyl-CoA hydratase-related protein [Candidatus Dormibacteraeota bacterium]|jgi:2-(1,2-epoxy-1,2-dihydrophenyl)acetyl-CoA isomerase|nr:enoyl-CoA hydratase-related protein [Candidatus Dormibacteraeota bacterium]
MTDEPLIRYEILSGVAWIRMNRPRVRNALDATMRAGLIEALRRAGGDGPVRVVVLAGEGPAFCAGNDLRELASPEDGYERIGEEYATLLRAIRGLGKPTIAALHGPTVGIAVPIVAACDLRYAAEGATLRVPFAELGLTVEGGASQTLPRLVGRGRALELFLTGRPLGAEEAERWGLVNGVVPEDQLESRVAEIAGRLAQAAPGAVAAIKRAVNHAEGHDFDEVLEFEFGLQGERLRSADFAERIRRAAG